MLDNYLNGALGSQGGPTFSGSQQGMGIAWMDWATPITQDNLGLLNTNGSLVSAQLNTINPLLYYSSSGNGLPGNGSTMWIVNTGSSQCIDMAGGSKTEVTQFDLYTCSSGWSQQQFTAELQSDGTYLFANRNSNMCIEIYGGSASPGAIVEQDTCNSNWWSQRFTLTPYGTSYSLVNKASGLCVVADSSGLLQQQACTGASSQLYRFE